MPIARLRHVVVNPPDDLAIRLAQIITHWSFEIWLLQEITYMILHTDSAHGRVAVRDPRPEEYITMIQQLMKLDGLTTSVSLDDLCIDLRQLKTLRDTVAHGVWLKNIDTGRIFIQIVSGTWIPPDEEERISRRVTPEGRGVDASGLDSIRDGIEDALLLTQKLYDEIKRQVASSTQKYQAQSASGHRPDDPTSSNDEPLPLAPL